MEPCYDCAELMILDELPCCLLLTWARTLDWSSLLLLICVSRKPQYLILCSSQWHPLPSYASSWEHTWSEWFTVQVDDNCSLIMIISFLETPGPVGFLLFFKSGSAENAGGISWRAHWCQSPVSNRATDNPVVVQSLSQDWLFAAPWTAAHQASLSSTISKSLLKLMSIESVMLSSHLIFCHPLLLLSSIFPSIRVFSKELALCIRWSKYWSFSFSISPSNEYSGLISFRINCFDLLAVQGTLRSLLQHHNSKASILWCSAYGPTSVHDY